MLAEKLQSGSARFVPSGRCGFGSTPGTVLAVAWRDRISVMTNTLTATLRTSQGTIVLRLFPDRVPKTVQNFVELAEGSREWADPASRKTTRAKLYDGTIFHRVIPKFMIQGGDPLGTGTGGPGYKFADEFQPDLTFDRPYLLAMANAGPNTNGSQFFITTVPTHHLNGRHTIFGEVISGSEVVDAISNVRTGRNDRPVNDVVLESVVIDRGADTSG
jgi:peptidyl-prolyl cis-trans isomerase A (cyclophilin A)